MEVMVEVAKRTNIWGLVTRLLTEGRIQRG
jgi:hypothetical protein